MSKKLTVFVVSLLLVAVVSACGMLFPEPEPEPEVEYEPEVVVEEPPVEPTQADPMAVCAANISLPGQPSYPLAYCADFEDPAVVNMALGELESKWGDALFDVYNGKYTARVEVKRDNMLTLDVPVGDMRDFVIQVEGRLASHSGHPYHSWGVFLKADEDFENYYYFKIDNNQYYFFRLVRGDRVTNLINGRRSEDLNPINEVNTLTVAVEGDTFSFYINGDFQEEFKDNRLLTGKVGLYSDMSKDTTLDWEFDNLVLYAP